MHKQRGFTLIELIVVIIILGILAAFIIPRFGELDKEARSAVVYGLEGSVRSAAAMVHGVSVARSATDPTATTSVTIGSATIALTNGYPTDTNEMAKLLESVTGFTSTGTDFTKDGSSTPASCKVSYAPPAAAGGLPTISNTVTGC